MNLILCGLPMCGKTTVGKLVAEQLDWQFVDTDRLIEQAYALNNSKSLTCRQIFSQDGEAIFRELERQAIGSLQQVTKLVIAVGGGSLNNPANTTVLQSLGSIIYLRGSVNELWKRIQLRGIPAYLDPEEPEKAYREMASRRTPLFEAAAHVVIETDALTPQDIAQTILREI